MILRPIGTTGDIASGTPGTFTMPKNPVLGGIAISADGTNTATVTLRKDSDSGDIFFDINTKTSMFIGAPIEAAETVHYTITGTNASAMFFEFVS